MRLIARGRHRLDRTTSSTIARGVEAFSEAIALDTDRALAHATLAEAYILLGDQAPVDISFQCRVPGADRRFTPADIPRLIPPGTGALYRSPTIRG